MAAHQFDKEPGPGVSGARTSAPTESAVVLEAPTAEEVAPLFQTRPSPLANMAAGVSRDPEFNPQTGRVEPTLNNFWLKLRTALVQFRNLEEVPPSPAERTNRERQLGLVPEDPERRRMQIAGFSDLYLDATPSMFYLTLRRAIDTSGVGVEAVDEYITLAMSLRTSDTKVSPDPSAAKAEAEARTDQIHRASARILVPVYMELRRAGYTYRDLI